MAKKSSGLSARAVPAPRSAKYIPDSEIDYSDIPESTDAELRRARCMAAKQSKPYLERAARKKVA